MASVKSRNQTGRKDEDHDFRNWRSPHQKSSAAMAADHFRHGAGSRRDHSTRENDRTGSHRTRYRHDRESKPHRWSSDRRAEPRSRKPDVYSSTEFPPLGSKEVNTSYTPDPVRGSSQLYSSSTSSSRDWASQIDQFEKDKERAMRDMMRYKRRLLMSESSDGSNEDQENVKVNMNAQPKKEYETDETVIVRRQKQIELGKNTLGYDHYLRQIPKYKRVKNEHIVTPNKFLKCSRRAWDGLIRQWRVKLHEYDPEGTYKPARVARKELHFSDTTSEATSEGSSEQDARMDLELNSSMSSAVSDYLASNEGSRPQTPDNSVRPETPTTELKDLTVSDDMNGNYQTGDSDLVTEDISQGKAVGSTPDATLTPSVTPADYEVEGPRPQVNPSDLIAALRHAAQVVQPPNQVTFHPGMYYVPPQLTSNLDPRYAADVSVHSFHRSCDDNVNPKVTKDTKMGGDIFDNFNLDDCFLNEDEVIG
ncbi:uncharacterized protein LOC119739750 [Patiria miniata]|uniref:Histone RNA hairpin-binding protein RNA-binding domain-containing protein n=1 Tax=Patiria miniata TaxID=46514 RepID=A0A914B4J3_PATMI|nr:uncharacterized protein LOC119739750 [Patiria miniata]